MHSYIQFKRKLECFYFLLEHDLSQPLVCYTKQLITSLTFSQLDWKFWWNVHFNHIRSVNQNLF